MGGSGPVAKPVPHLKVKLIVGMLSGFPALFDRAEEILVERFGPVSHCSDTIPFTFSDYYEPEMGAGLLRRFAAFERPADAGDLAEIKLWTNGLEMKLAGPEWPVPRPINLDPGYVDLSKLVLASTKDHAHRVYLGKGIFAEVTLSYTDGAFRPLPWTYPDFRTEAYREFFERVRADFYKSLRAPGNST